MTSRSFRCALVLLVACACTLAVAQNPAPYKVGELELTDVSTNGITPLGVNQWTVAYPGATYIRVHFSEFDLAPGDSLSIATGDGSYVRTFTDQGPHGTGHFWAATMPGETAVITLNATVGTGSGFTIDSFGRGIEQVFDLEPNDPPGGETPESVCGAQDWRDAECYNNDPNYPSYPDEYEQSKAAAKAFIGCCSTCTGFKVSDSGQFLTNEHCSTNPPSVEFLMNYKNNSCGGGGTSNLGSVFGTGSVVASDYTLDYSLMNTTGDSSNIPCLELDNRLAPEGEDIFIAGHPSGNPLKMSIQSTYSLNPDGECQVDDSPHSGRGANSDVGYYCDTTGGSSGSPVISRATGKVIALHHFGGCLNSGGRSDWILSDIGNRLDSCTGGSGGTCTSNAECDNGLFCDGAETCDGNGNCQSGSDPCPGQDCDEANNVCVDPPTCAPKGADCTSNSDCCGNKCRGKRTAKTCK